MQLQFETSLQEPKVDVRGAGRFGWNRADGTARMVQPLPQPTPIPPGPPMPQPEPLIPPYPRPAPMPGPK